MHLSRRALDLLARSGELRPISHRHALRVIAEPQPESEDGTHIHVYQCDGEWYLLRHRHGPAVDCDRLARIRG
jgi:hypothetical protein